MSTTTMNSRIHEGRNIKRFREMLNITQEALAADLGDDWSQKKISLLEGKDKVEAELLDQVAKVLKVPAEAIKNFSEEAAINIISSTLYDNAGSVNNNCTLTFNPLEKYLEAVEEIKRLYAELLQSEREKVALLERILKEYKKD